MTPFTKIFGICCLVFFIGFMSAMIIVPIVQHKKATKGLEKHEEDK